MRAKEEEMARKYSALASEKKEKEKTIKGLTEERGSLCRVVEIKQRELDEANRARCWVEQVKVSHEHAIAWFQGELCRLRYVADGLNASCKEFKDKNEQLLSQVACMAKKIEVADIELGKMRCERAKERDELNKVARNKRSNNPTEEEEEVSSVRKKGKFELSRVQGENVLESDTESSDDSSGSDINGYPEPDFKDFEKDRGEDCFAANQIWATYDSTDSLPRAYALVRDVASPFKLKITKLEPDPDDEGEIDWCDADLPIACGKFVLGDSEYVTDRDIFCHRLRGMKRTGSDSYMLHPKKGETWAIFRDWDIKWSSDPENHVTDEFEYVEILSDFTQDVGIQVAYLVKVEGFVSLFQKAKKNGVNMFCVLPNELYRFSHQIPSYKMTGKERKGVPRGCFELDTAALLLT
ncbi:uncharacterized protein LOC130720897 [Lotus japonicus]|uniref:uncharacterized protein LOC130720897 n=1 Tax=Lotus japonicus TaxID=34305 RepID=UPI00258FA315|nr:uncharacterized protein LOC130720897 [Lotus japonicus]